MWSSAVGGGCRSVKEDPAANGGQNGRRSPGLLEECKGRPGEQHERSEEVGLDHSPKVLETGSSFSFLF